MGDQRHCPGCEASVDPAVLWCPRCGTSVVDGSTAEWRGDSGATAGESRTDRYGDYLLFSVGAAVQAALRGDLARALDWIDASRRGRGWLAAGIGVAAWLVLQYYSSTPRGDLVATVGAAALTVHLVWQTAARTVLVRGAVGTAAMLVLQQAARAVQAATGRGSFERAALTVDVSAVVIAATLLLCGQMLDRAVARRS